MGLMGDYHCDIDELPVIYMIPFFLHFWNYSGWFCDFGWSSLHGIRRYFMILHGYSFTVVDGLGLGLDPTKPRSWHWMTPWLPWWHRWEEWVRCPATRNCLFLWLVKEGHRASTGIYDTVSDITILLTTVFISIYYYTVVTCCYYKLLLWSYYYYYICYSYYDHYYCD